MDEKLLIAGRAKLHSRLTAWMGAPQGRFATVGRYRKSLRCYGCGRSRCQLCHPEKFPKRVPTLREKLVDKDLRDYQRSDGD